MNCERRFQRLDSAVRFGFLHTPIGRLFVSVSDKGVWDITFGETSEQRYRNHLLRWVSSIVRDHNAVESALSELDAYFAGSLRKFSVPVDLRRVTEFTERVLQATRRIPFGQLLNYGEVAKRIGAPTASRAVGGALGRNPVPIIIPCHRVISRGGELGGFAGGLKAKRTLLRIEGYGLVPRI